MMLLRIDNQEECLVRRRNMRSKRFRNVTVVSDVTVPHSDGSATRTILTSDGVRSVMTKARGANAWEILSVSGDEYW
jgi:predicted Fe-Mo cluster-binding NifX family protein